MWIFVCVWTLTPLHSFFHQSRPGRSGHILLRIGSCGVHVISITGLSYSQISQGSKGLCEVCHHQPINAPRVQLLCLQGRLYAPLQLHTSTPLYPTAPALFLKSNYSALWKGFVTHTWTLHNTRGSEKWPWSAWVQPAGFSARRDLHISHPL